MCKIDHKDRPFLKDIVKSDNFTKLQNMEYNKRREILNLKSSALQFIMLFNHLARYQNK